MPTPTQVTCPTCATQLDLTGLSQIPPQVRCGQCGTVFATQDAAMQAMPRQRWRGEDEAHVGGSSRSHDELLPPGASVAGEGSAESKGETHRSHSPVSSKSPADEPFDPTPPHLRGERAAQVKSSHTGDVPLPVATTAPTASRKFSEKAKLSKKAQLSEKSGSPASDGPIVTVGGVPLQVDNEDLNYRRHAKKHGISAVWVVTALILFTVVPGTILAGVYLVNGTIPIPGWGADVPIAQDENKSLNPSEIHWSDASRYSARLSGIKIKVDRVQFGEVRARTESLDIQESQDDAYLQLWLNVSNQRSRPVNYSSWYGTEFESEGELSAAVLTDSNENVYPMLVFSDAKEIQGHIASAEVGPDRSIGDTVVFEIPSTVEIEQVEYLRLSLPAAAFGEPGTVRFEIPGKMLQDARRGAGILGGESQLKATPEEKTDPDPKTAPEAEPPQFPPMA